jgi:hypothetical protein
MRLALRIALNRQPGYGRAISAVLLGAFVVTAAGIPLPLIPLAAKSNKANRAFMCANSSCGCVTAEQCWRACCCHTLGERLAWARANGVRPPDFAIATARAAGHDLSWLNGPRQAQVRLIGRSDCCHKPNRDGVHSCCHRAHRDTPPNTTHSCCSNEQNAEPQPSVIAWRALKCGGHSMNWLTAVPTLVNVRAEFDFEVAPPAWLQPLASDRAGGAADLPPVPPPERA